MKGFVLSIICSLLICSSAASATTAAPSGSELSPKCACFKHAVKILEWCFAYNDDPDKCVDTYVADFAECGITKPKGYKKCVAQINGEDNDISLFN